MAFVVEEIGRSADIGDDANTERNYYASGYANEAAATSAVLAYLVADLGNPPNIGGQVLARIAPTEAEIVGDWRVRAAWHWVQKQQPPAQLTSASSNPSTEDAGELSFDITLDTVNIQSAFQTQPFPSTGKTLSSGGNAINLNPKTKIAEGVDVYDAVFGWSETHYFHSSRMTRGFRRNLMRCAGKWNNSSFRSNPAGEVLFAGCTGKKRSQHDYALTYQFKHRENITLDLSGLNIPDPVNKRGWDYVEVVYDIRQEDDDPPTAEPRGVLIHTPIDSANFSLLGIGT